VVQANLGQKPVNSKFYEFYLIGHKHATFHLTQCMMQMPPLPISIAVIVAKDHVMVHLN
jgi:hypothetical protein